MSTTGLPEAPEDVAAKKKKTSVERGVTRANKRGGVMSQKAARSQAQRAKELAAKARSKVRIYFMVTEPVFDVLLDLAEEFERSPMDIARQAMVDGLRQFREFRTPYDFEDPFEKRRQGRPRNPDAGRPPRRGIIDRTTVLQARDEDEEHAEQRGREDAEDADVRSFVDAVQNREVLKGFLPGSPTAPRKPKPAPIDYGPEEKRLKGFNENANVSELSE